MFTYGTEQCLNGGSQKKRTMHWAKKIKENPPSKTSFENSESDDRELDIP
jgi:hypothetical protein